jgi:hypothetical protein
METADWEPDRRTVTVRMRRCDVTGRLGVKISHTPSGIYVESLEENRKSAAGNEEKPANGVERKSANRDGRKSASFGDLTGKDEQQQQQQQLCRGDRLLAVNGRSIEHLGKEALKIVDILLLCFFFPRDQCCRSRIRCLFYSLNPGSGSGMKVFRISEIPCLAYFLVGYGT